MATSWPALVKSLAAVAPMFPAPIIPIFIPLPSPQRLRLKEKLVGVTPHPIFARLERTNHRVLRRAVMFRRVLVRRRIAAANVTAGQAQSQMHPVSSDAQTVFAAFSAGRHVLNLIQMRAGVLHYSSSIEFVVESVSGNRT